MDGSRVNAVIQPLALEGPMLSIRRFGVRLGIEELLAEGSIPAEAMAFLQAAVEARISVLISGGAGSGKTTLLRCLVMSLAHLFRPDEAEIYVLSFAGRGLDAFERLPVAPHETAYGGFLRKDVLFEIRQRLNAIEPGP